jgi:hypothetical protein
MATAGLLGRPAAQAHDDCDGQTTRRASTPRFLTLSASGLHHRDYHVIAVERRTHGLRRNHDAQSRDRPEAT